MEELEDLDILTLRAFVLALYQLPSLPPELQTALQNLPLEVEAMLKEIYKLTKQEPLAQKYRECRLVFQPKEGKRTKSDQPTTNNQPTNEITNVSEDIAEIETLRNQGGTFFLQMVEDIRQNPEIAPKTIIDSCLGLPSHG